jgi:DNA-binding transcriptional ArsR family regulator
MATHSQSLPTVFAALADPTRFAVMERLIAGPASVSDLGAPFPMAGPSFLKHLRVLEDAGLVRSAKRGRVRTVTLVPERLNDVADWFAWHRREWDARFDRLGALLNEGDDHD